MQKQFSLGNHVDKHIVICPEVKDEFRENMDSGLMQQCVTKEKVSLSVKHGKDISCVWTAPIFLAGNTMPLRGIQNALNRRIVILDWAREVKQEDVDGQLGAKIESELLKILIKTNNLFICRASRYTKNRPPLTAWYENFRKQYVSEANPLAKFLNDDMFLKKTNDQSVYIRQSHLHKLYRDYVKENGITNAPDISKVTTTRAFFGPNRSIQIQNGMRKWPPISINGREPVMDRNPRNYYVGICLKNHYSSEIRNVNTFYLKNEIKLLIQSRNETAREEMLRLFSEAEVELTSENRLGRMN